MSTPPPKAITAAMSRCGSERKYPTPAPTTRALPASNPHKPARNHVGTTLTFAADPMAAGACTGDFQSQFFEVDQIRSCDSLRERAVIDAAGVTIGYVDCVLLDPTSWQIKAVRVTLR